tara:strand:+ start:8961 stop:9629 length:669 start_codon:yes stop_codon:yes gene_type:complete
MPTTTKEVAVAESTELATPNETIAGIDANDIDIPRINIVQKTSDIDFDTGSVVLDKTHEILTIDTKGPCIVLAAIKKWREDVPFDDDVMPKIANTREEADVMSTLNSSPDGNGYDIIEWADITLLFPQPEGVDDPDTFPFPIGDNNYAIGRINVAKDAYRKTFKALATFATFNKTVSLNSRLWTFESQLMSRGKYSWCVPTLTVSQEKTPQEVLDFAQSFGL